MNFKKISMLFVVLILAGMTAYAQSDISGKWNSTYSTPNGDLALVFNFKVEKDALTGTIGSEMGQIVLENGKADGKTFTYDFFIQDRNIKHKGEQISENEILIKSDTGELKLTRAKE
ncbi:hypothetical protein [Algoriphagus chordae]|uniref:Uncharacterized protein n=1 Tax=Algoriphagus chordae TaxID=237019 RepID=A0A2W7QRK8_9BACT|nr:hypothetical protein [Algoriphagus chordae]PZX46467.1 hypothetical protein LV85_04274 [Algoriphagus chordae]